ncbi:PREDICTED: enhancer of mRNA-decapping protein 3 isoform X2 [Ceratosolen solmsi marchali]|uniref:Enhancer of mRNA-decapping protein 3 n=1 Tax=Ceratosolen solmsi marchali TaxID=326594 RepID=A0AAJ6VKQ0_9HYME|nr:PREDICTED: enhancer of mRNA-decapping protein 3 isoform X2 [Ceratosolen solmsi marchali]
MSVSDRFVGSTVSIKCIDDLGSYQGEIIALTDELVTLTRVFWNGKPYSSPTVRLRAKDISNVYIINTEYSAPVRQEPQVLPSVKKLLPEGKDWTDLTVPNGKPVLSRRDGTLRRRMSERDEQAFGTPIDQSLHQDFDFEKNLALFNKEAVWQEINSKKPDVVQQSQNKGGNKARYRHDENVIESEPLALRQIVVPNAGPKEYVTDDGLIIPSVTLDLQRQLIGAADRLGISWERRVELLGRAGTEITLQLLGGAHRLSPNNAHQWPTVVVLCGPHRSGAAGINCARQLSSHGVKTIIYVESSEDVFVLQELSLYRLTGHKVETEVKKLPAATDLIIVALCEERSPKCVTPVAKWASNNRASVLAIEPPSNGTPGIVCKYSLVSGLPLSHCHDNGRLYLCNLALPNKLFSEVGITYRSPFGPKFVIPLHPNSS